MEDTEYEVDADRPLRSCPNSCESSIYGDEGMTLEKTEGQAVTLRFNDIVFSAYNGVLFCTFPQGMFNTEKNILGLIGYQ